jgi:2'-5' RNA ligase
VRLFVGAFLSDEWRDSLSAAGGEVRHSEPVWRDAKWVPEPNLHLTLAFFGDVDDDAVQRLDERVRLVAASHAAMSLPFRAVRARPSRGRARMLWAGFDDPDGRCAALAAAVTEAGAEAGGRRDDRAYRPHVTLCRARRPLRVSQATLDQATHIIAASGSLSVPSITLCSSTLTPRGAEYTQKGTWPLLG